MFAWLVQNTLLAALLALGVAVFCRLSRCRPAVRHILWLLVLARLLMPPGLHWPWALPVTVARHAAPIAVVPAPQASPSQPSAVEMVHTGFLTAAAGPE